MVVGWGTDDVLGTATDDKEVTVLDAGNKAYTLAALFAVDGGGEVLVQVVDEHAGVVGFEVSAIVGDNLAVLECNDVAADGKVVVTHLIADRGGLQGAAALVDLVQVVTENGGVGHLGAWRETFGNGDETTCAATAGQLIHHGLVGILQQGLPAESLDGKICHSISKNDYMFHQMLAIDMILAKTPAAVTAAPAP